MIVFGISALFASVCIAAPLAPSPYKSIVVFGDSFSDNGNEYKLSNQTWPADPAYYKGRFSNGPTWVEDVASSLQVPLHDYAYGGATSDNRLVQGYSGVKATLPVPSLADQVSSYLAGSASTSVIGSTLFALLGGANDIFFAPNITAAQSAGLISGLVTQLRDAGARHFLLLNYPDLSQIPYDSFVDRATQAQLHTFSVDLGNSLQSIASGIRATGADPKEPSQVAGRAKVSVTVVDLVAVFESFGYYEGGWKKEGFASSGSYGSCLTGVYMETEKRTLCKDPEKRVFWDEYHPTRHSHRIIANEVELMLRK